MFDRTGVSKMLKLKKAINKRCHNMVSAMKSTCTIFITLIPIILIVNTALPRKFNEVQIDKLCAHSY